MGSILSSSIENEIIKFIRQDNPKKLQDILVNNNLNPDALYTSRKRNLIQLCCYYLSPKCLSKLIEMNYDYNKKEISTNYNPLYIACKFNSLPIVKILLSKEDCKILQKNNDNFNELEIAFLKGNYEICYYLLFEYKNNKINENKLNINKKDNNNNINNKNNEEEINTNIQNENDKEKEKDIKNEIDIDMNQPYQKFFFTTSNFDIQKYLELQSTNQFPLFNMQLFYESLCNKIPPKKTSSFAAERKRTKELLTKIPDPNETWGNFFKRLVNLELYNPPLVDKRNVSQMNSLYMNAQMKLIENEYGIKLSYYNQNEEEEEKKILGDNEENEGESVINIVKKKRNMKIINESENVLNDDNNEENVDKKIHNSLRIDIDKKPKERKAEEIKIGNKENLCVLNIQNNSSDRNIKNSEIIDEEKK